MTIAAPYTVRPLAGATVSCALRWQEVNGYLRPSRFTIKSILPRCARIKDPMALVFRKGIDIAAALSQIEKKFATHIE